MTSPSNHVGRARKIQKNSLSKFRFELPLTGVTLNKGREQFIQRGKRRQTVHSNVRMELKAKADEMESNTEFNLCHILCELTQLLLKFFAETLDTLQFVMIYNPAQDTIPTPLGISHFGKYIKIRQPIKSSETLWWRYIKLFGIYA